MGFSPTDIRLFNPDAAKVELLVNQIIHISVSFCAFLKIGVSHPAEFKRYRKLCNLMHRHDISLAVIFNFIHTNDQREDGSGADHQTQRRKSTVLFSKTLSRKRAFAALMFAAVVGNRQLVNWNEADYWGSIAVSRPKQCQARHSIR